MRADLLESRPDTVVVAGAFSIGDVTFAMYGVSQVLADDVAGQVALSGFRFGRVRMIANNVDAYNEFVGVATKVEKIDSVVSIYARVLGRSRDGYPSFC